MSKVLDRAPLLIAFSAFVSLGLPDGLLGVAWPSMRRSFDVPIDAVGALLVAFTASYMLAGMAAGTLLSRVSVGAAGARSTARIPSVWLGAATFFLYTGVEASAGVWTYSLLSARGVPMTQAGLAVGAYWASLAVGRVVHGAVVEPTSLVAWLRGSLAFLLVAAITLATARSPSGCVTAAAALGLAAGPIFPSLMASTPGRVDAGAVASTVGMQIAGAAAGQWLIPVAVGLAARHAGLEAAAFALVAGAAAVALLHELLLRAATAPRREGATP